MALRPPVSAMSGTMAPRRSASARWIAQPVALEPVKATPATRGSLTRAAPTAPSPGSSCSTPGGTPASLQQLGGQEGDDGRLLGRLGEHRVAGRQRRRHLAGEDRQREVPRARCRRTARGPRSSRVLVSPVGPLSATGPANSRRASRRVVAQEVDGLAHVAERVLQRLAGLAHHHRHQAHAVALVEVGGLVEDRRARRAAQPVPGVRRPLRARDRLLDRRGIGRAHRADALAPVVRAQHELRRLGAGQRLAVDDGRGGERRLELRGDLGQQRLAHGGLVERHAAAVAAARAGRSPADAAAARGAAPALPLGLDDRHGIARRSPRSAPPSSASRLTNEVLAPFSSRRRTRYATRSSCGPTGA